MNAIQRQKLVFEQTKRVYESAILTFHGVHGWDVYNCSVPFMYRGKLHMFGRVEKRDEWANSHVRLFVETGKDEFSIVSGVRTYDLEDPFVAKVKGEMILGGTQVRKSCGNLTSYCSYFLRGSPDHMTHFTVGPDNMKDVRLVQLASGRIGVFSRPRTELAASIGFTVIDHVEELGEGVIKKAVPLNLLQEGAWGGVNQPYLLTSGKIGCIAHYSFLDHRDDAILSVYVNYAFVVNPDTMEVEGEKIIGSRGSYPASTAKVKKLVDCVFASGIVMRPDGKCDLYSGLGDTEEGRITIDYPFEGFGLLADPLVFDDRRQSRL